MNEIGGRIRIKEGRRECEGRREEEGLRFGRMNEETGDGVKSNGKQYINSLVLSNLMYRLDRKSLFRKLLKIENVDYMSLVLT